MVAREKGLQGSGFFAVVFQYDQRFFRHSKVGGDNKVVNFTRRKRDAQAVQKAL
jgi:hypothetical protein